MTSMTKIRFWKKLRKKKWWLPKRKRLKSRDVKHLSPPEKNAPPVNLFLRTWNPLFTQVVNEVIDEKSKQSPSVKRNADKIRKKVKPLSGLDALIRRTSLADHTEDDHPNG